ncbi:MAG: hypothetical protein IJM79_06305 [Erysipelotrichaceae bacterium]|nr:hypothetical protein [Erysipelotrichaceae bacterium]
MAGSVLNDLEQIAQEKGWFYEEPSDKEQLIKVLNRVAAFSYVQDNYDALNLQLGEDAFVEEYVNGNMSPQEDDFDDEPYPVKPVLPKEKSRETGPSVSEIVGSLGYVVIYAVMAISVIGFFGIDNPISRYLEERKVEAQLVFMAVLLAGAFILFILLVEGKESHVKEHLDYFLNHSKREQQRIENNRIALEKYNNEMIEYEDAVARITKRQKQKTAEKERKIKQLKEEARESYPESQNALMLAAVETMKLYSRDYLEAAKALLHPKYHCRAEELAQIIEEGRASGIQEAINVLLNDDHNREVLHEAQRKNELLQQQLQQEEEYERDRIRRENRRQREEEERERRREQERER